MQNYKSTKVSNGRKRFNGGKVNSFKNNKNQRFSRNKKNGEKIDITQFIHKSSLTEPPKPTEIKSSFADFALSDQLQANIRNRNYHTPTPIQDQSIGHILEGRDLVGLANTGTGKTGAFLLPLIEKISNDRSQKVMIIAPTRELALQIEQELRNFSRGMKISYSCCVGGMSIHTQIQSLRRNPKVVIGTPGRLRDLSDRRVLRFESFNNIVLDEVDRMLDMGFVDEITDFLSWMPEERQSLFFSATIPPKIKTLVNGFSKDPVMVEVRTGVVTSNVDQNVIEVRHKDMKFDKLQELLSSDELKKVLIFNDTKHGTERLALNLIKKGFRAESIHGDKRQSQRQRSLALFKNSSVDILVATDVAARGLDIKDVTHVINYTVPQTYDDYIHRIGRTGRAGSKGIALTFVEAG